VKFVADKVALVPFFALSTSVYIVTERSTNRDVERAENGRQVCTL
jgi:hypothetical protein